MAGWSASLPQSGLLARELALDFCSVPVAPGWASATIPLTFVRLQIDYQRLLHEFGDRVRHVHLKDTEIMPEKLYESGNLGEAYSSTYVCGEGWWRYTIPGEGEVDWNFVVRRLEDVGYDGVLSVELEDHYFWQTPELQQEGLLRAKDHIEPLLRG